MDGGFWRFSRDAALQARRGAVCDEEATSPPSSNPARPAYRRGDSGKYRLLTAAGAQQSER